MSLASRSRIFRLERLKAAPPIDGAPKAPEVYKFRANDGEFDRYQDRLSVSGWQLDAFNANPVLLYNHDAGDGGFLGLGRKDVLPIGKARVYVEGDALMAEVEFDQDDDFARRVEGKVQKGMLNAVSVRYIMHRYHENERGGFDSEEQELLELSIVTIPGNQRAVRAKGLADMTPDERELFEAFSARVAEKILQSTADAGRDTAPPASSSQPEQTMTPEEIKAMQAEMARLKAVEAEAMAAKRAEEAAKAAAAKDAEDSARAAKIADMAAAKVIEQAKGNRDGFAAVLAGANAPAKKFSAVRDDASFGAFLKMVAASDRNPSKDRVLAMARRFGGEDLVKALQESNFDSAGVLVPVQTSGELIEYLRPVSVLDKLGVRTIAFKSEMHIPKQTGTSALVWIGEGDTVEETKPSFGKVVLKAHKAMLLMNLSNDLLRNPAVGDAFAGQDARIAMAHGLDDTALNGSGQGNTPKGLLKQVNVANVFARAGTNIADYVDDADKAIQLVLDANIPITNPAWLMSPAKERELKGLRDGAGWLFRDEMRDGHFNGYPYFVSTRVPAARVIFGCWDQFIQAIDEDVMFSMHDVRAQYDETVLRGILRADFKVRHDEAFAVIKDS